MIKGIKNAMAKKDVTTAIAFFIRNALNDIMFIFAAHQKKIPLVTADRGMAHVAMTQNVTVFLFENGELHHVTEEHA